MVEIKYKSTACSNTAWVASAAHLEKHLPETSCIKQAKIRENSDKISSDNEISTWYLLFAKIHQQDSLWFLMRCTIDEALVSTLFREKSSAYITNYNTVAPFFENDIHRTTGII